MTMLGGRLPVTENKRICLTSGPTTGRGPLRNLSSGRLEQYLTEKQTGQLQSGRKIIILVLLYTIFCLQKPELVTFIT